MITGISTIVLWGAISSGLIVGAGLIAAIGSVVVCGF